MDSNAEVAASRVYDFVFETTDIKAQPRDALWQSQYAAHAARPV